MHVHASVAILDFDRTAHLCIVMEVMVIKPQEESAVSPTAITFCGFHTSDAPFHAQSAKLHGMKLILALGNLWPAYVGPEDYLRIATGSAGVCSAEMGHVQKCLHVRGILRSYTLWSVLSCVLHFPLKSPPYQQNAAMILKVAMAWKARSVWASGDWFRYTKHLG